MYTLDIAYSDTRRIQEAELMRLFKGLQADEQQQIRRIAKWLLFPSDDLAKIHRDAHSLNKRDIYNKDQTVAQIPLCDRCSCCGYPKSTGPLNICTSVREFKGVGASVVIFFNDLLLGSVLMLITFLVYGLYAIYTNWKFKKVWDGCNGSEMCHMLMSISLASKLSTPEGDRYYMIESYIGIGLLVLWYLFFHIKRYHIRDLQAQHDRKSTTASDFTLLIKDLPKSCNKKTLQDLLEKYRNLADQNGIGQVASYFEVPMMEIKNFSIGRFNDACIQELYLQRQREFEKLKDQRSEKEESLKRVFVAVMKDEQYNKYSEQAKRLLEEYKNARKQVTKFARKSEEEAQRRARKYIQEEKKYDYAFVTLNTDAARRLIENYHLNKKTDFLCIKAPPSNLPLDTKYRQIKEVCRAPEPEEILWENIRINNFYRNIRNFVTSVATFLILMVSFAFVYFCEYVSFKEANKIPPYVIGIAINVFGIILDFVIGWLTEQEGHYLLGYQEAAATRKGLVAGILNEIVIMVVVSLILKQDVYQPDGLARDAFWVPLGLWIPITSKILKFEAIWRLLKRGWYQCFPKQKLFYGGQTKYNEALQKPQFSVISEYVDLIKMTVFVAFFLPLQPIISLVAAFALLILYGAEKISLFYICSKPIPLSAVATTELRYYHKFSMFAFGMGSIFWPLVLPRPYTSRIIPNYVCLALGFILWVAPVPKMTPKPYVQKQDSRSLPYQPYNPANLITDYPKKNAIGAGVFAGIRYSLPLNFQGALGTIDTQRPMYSSTNAAAKNQYSLERQEALRNWWKDTEILETLHKNELKSFDDLIENLKDDPSNSKQVLRRVEECMVMQSHFNNREDQLDMKLRESLKQSYEREMRAEPQRVSSLQVELEYVESQVEKRKKARENVLNSLKSYMSKMSKGEQTEPLSMYSNYLRRLQSFNDEPENDIDDLTQIDMGLDSN